MTKLQKKVLKIFVVLFLLSLGHLIYKMTSSAFPSFGVVVVNEDKTPGYFMYAPLQYQFALIDKSGETVRSWSMSRPVFHATLIPNKRIAVLMGKKGSNRGLKDAAFGVLDEIGKIIWEFDEGAIHHDFEVLPNENVLLIRRSDTPFKVTSRHPLFKKNFSYVCDDIIEVTPQGQVVKTFKLQDAFDIRDYVDDIDFSEDGLDYKKKDVISYCHGNSVRFLERDPVTQRKAILVSLRNTNVVLMIDYETQKTIWASKPKTLERQHDARLTEDGQIMIFDNGPENSNIRLEEVRLSEVLTINPKNDEVTYLTGGSGFQFPYRSTFMSGAKSLSPSRLWVSLSSTGQIVEIDIKRNVVWRFIGVPPPRNKGLHNIFFKANHYTPDQVPNSWKPLHLRIRDFTFGKKSSTPLKSNFASESTPDENQCGPKTVNWNRCAAYTTQSTIGSTIEVEAKIASGVCEGWVGKAEYECTANGWKLKKELSCDWACPCCY